MARLPERARYKDCPISREDDPLRFHYWPVIGRLYRRRIDGCVALLETGRRVLDVGYGSGASFLELGTRFDEVHGLDTHNYGTAIANVFAREGPQVSLYAWARTHEIVREAIRPERVAYVTLIPAESQSRHVILLEGTRVLGTNEHLQNGDARAGCGAFFGLITAPLLLGFRQ